MMQRPANSLLDHDQLVAERGNYWTQPGVPAGQQWGGQQGGGQQGSGGPEGAGGGQQAPQPGQPQAPLHVLRSARVSKASRTLS